MQAFDHAYKDYLKVPKFAIRNCNLQNAKACLAGFAGVPPGPEPNRLTFLRISHPVKFGLFWNTLCSTISTAYTRHPI